jgi:nucleoside-diphosphate-sugar epimerase
MAVRNIFITGINGFVGSHLNRHLTKEGYSVTGSVRKSKNKMYFETGELDEFDDWNKCIKNTDVVIHVAARVHKQNNSLMDEQKCIAVNCDATIKLAKAAIKKGVRKFIFLSTVGVNGGFTNGSKFSAISPHNPQNSYSKSKFLAESRLLNLCQNVPMELFILRIPLVYGGNVPGNVFRLRKIIATGMPIPFGGIANLKSFIHIDNLNTYISSCLLARTLKPLILFPSDKEDISTSDFVELLTKLEGKKPNLFWFFPFFINLFLRIVFKNNLADSLYKNLLVSDHVDGHYVNFDPVFNPKQYLRETK